MTRGVRTTSSLLPCTGHDLPVHCDPPPRRRPDGRRRAHHPQDDRAALAEGGVNGFTTDSAGTTRAGFSATGDINRINFGVCPNPPIVGLASKEVHLDLEISAILRPNANWIHRIHQTFRAAGTSCYARCPCRLLPSLVTELSAVQSMIQITKVLWLYKGERGSQRLRSCGLIGPPALSMWPNGFWRNPGDDLEIEPSGRPRRPTQTNTPTCASGLVSRSAIFQGLIRDEEAAGSNPATPTGKRQVTGHHVACRLHYPFPVSDFGRPLGA